MTFKVGDRVRVISAKIGFYNSSLGLIGTISTIERNGVCYVAFDNGEGDSGLLEELKKLTEDFAPRIKACLEKRKARKPVFDRATWRPKIGDKCRVIGNHYRCTIGDIVTFAEDDRSENPYFHDGAGDLCCISLAKLEPI